MSRRISPWMASDLVTSSADFWYSSGGTAGPSSPETLRDVRANPPDMASASSRPGPSRSKDSDSDTDSVIEIPRAEMGRRRQGQTNGRRERSPGFDDFLRRVLGDSSILDFTPETPSVRSRADFSAGFSKKRSGFGGGGRGGGRPGLRRASFLADLLGGGRDGSDDDSPSGLPNLSSLLEDMLEKMSKSSDGRTRKVHKHWAPLHFAAQQNKLTLARALLNKGGIVD